MDLMETEELKESIQQYQQQTGEKFPADTKLELFLQSVIKRTVKKKGTATNENKKKGKKRKADEEDEDEDEEEDEDEKKDSEEEEEKEGLLNLTEVHLKLMLLYHYLVQYVVHGFRKGFKELDTSIPADLKGQIMRKFKHGQGVEQKNKVILYVIITALHINDFFINVDEIAADLGINVALCVQYAMAAGCFRVEKNSPRMKLSAPVKIYDPTSSKKGKAFKRAK